MPWNHFWYNHNPLNIHTMHGKVKGRRSGQRTPIEINNTNCLLRTLGPRTYLTKNTKTSGELMLQSQKRTLEAKMHARVAIWTIRNQEISKKGPAWHKKNMKTTVVGLKNQRQVAQRDFRWSTTLMEKSGGRWQAHAPPCACVWDIVIEEKHVHERWGSRVYSSMVGLRGWADWWVAILLVMVV